jgi:spore maturation protein CgeB
MRKRLSIVTLGLSLSSSWGNGHATTFRALIKGLDALGHDVLFLERDVPWYAAHRDLPDPHFCRLAYYTDVTAMIAAHGAALRAADAVIVGSYVPDGVAVIDAVKKLHPQCLAFYDIDTPVTLRKLADGDLEYLAPLQVPDFDIYFSFSGGPVLRTIEERFGARRALPLYCSVDRDLYQPVPEPVTWDLGYLGTYSPDRQPVLERLLMEPARQLPDMRFVVAGPQYPQDIAWSANVERIDHLPPSEHARFYSRQRFTLNVTRADMVAAGWSPSVRLFEAAACATPVISDIWPGLETLFPFGEALVAASDTADVVATLTANGRERARRIGETAKRIVLRDHTGYARAVELVEAIAAEAGRRRGRLSA